MDKRAAIIATICLLVSVGVVVGIMSLAFYMPAKYLIFAFFIPLLVLLWSAFYNWIRSMESE